MLAYLAPVLVFGLVIFIHELGHFMAAKLTGVYAPRFSIGFGPALFRRRRGETEYVLSVLPLGGFVRMASRLDADAASMEGGLETDGLKPGDAGYDPNAMMPFGPLPVPENRWFESKSLAARLFIMIAGVTMNILLAFVIYTAINIGEGEQLIATRVVGMVHPLAGAPTLAQLGAGDTVVAVNGRAVQTWDGVLDGIAAARGGAVTIRTNRTEISIPVDVPGAPSAKEVAQAIEFYRPSVIGQVVPGSPASRAGLRAGDTVSAIGGQPVHLWSELVERVSPSAGKDLAFQVQRGGKTVALTIRPDSTPDVDPVTKAARTVGRVGAASFIATVQHPLTMGDAIRGGARQTWFVATSVLETVKKLATRQISVRELGGPIAITRASVAAGQSGLLSIFALIALISVNVAVLNLLPIPILDGGQIVMNVAETIKGSAFSMRTREYILRVGLFAILLIFAMSTYNDVLRFAREHRWFGLI